MTPTPAPGKSRPGNADAAESKRPGKRRRRWAWRVLLLLTLVFGALVGRAIIQLRATPDYWQQNRAFIEQTPEPELTRLAKNVEARLPSEWTRPVGDGDGIKTIRVNFDEVNAWLAVRLPSYLDNQGVTLPREVGQFMLTQRDGRLVVAFDYESQTFGPRIASVFFKLRPPPPESFADAAGTQGQPMAVGIRYARAGEQNLPVKYLTKMLRDQPRFSDPAWREVLDALGRREFVAVPPLPVDDHRRATVLNVEVQPEGVDVTVRVQYTRDVEAAQ